MIVSLGDAVVDLVASRVGQLPAWGEDREVDHITAHRGGAALNVAVNLAFLGNRAALVAGVGDDTWAQFLRSSLADSGVNHHGLITVDAPTAVTMVLTGSEDRAFVSVYGATAALRADQVTFGHLQAVEHIHISGYWQSRSLAPQLPALCAAWKEQGISLSLDVGYDATGKWDSGIHTLLPLMDLFFPNEEEACGIAGEADWHKALDRLAEMMPWVVLKRGADGATVRWGSAGARFPAYPTTVVDTTGAGDAFNSGFLHGWLCGWTPGKALEYGCAMGALCVAREGGSTLPPTLAEVEQVVAGGAVPADRITPSGQTQS